LKLTCLAKPQSGSTLLRTQLVHFKWRESVKLFTFVLGFKLLPGHFHILCVNFSECAVSICLAHASHVTGISST